MRLSIFFTVILMVFISSNIRSQHNEISSCGFDIINNKSIYSDKTELKKYLEFEKQYKNYCRKNIVSRTNPNYTLPIVVHVIHNGGSENITDEEILRGIENLNEAYANIGYYDQNTGVNTGIQFCLASRDPNGQPITGIDRVQSSLTNMDIYTDDLALKNLTRWDPYHYINIWLVRDICAGNSCSVVGYAYFPTSHGTDIDGLVVEADYFSKSKGSSSVQVHEMGHYLGLFHTFQGGCKNDNCLEDGDKVCDTPPDASTARVACGDDFNSCNTDANSGFSTDQNDMYWNYMDYGDFNCYSAFTEGQRNRMIFSIENIRASLLQSKACIPNCDENIIVDFDIAKDTFKLGETVNLTNTSSSNTTTFSWEIDGEEKSTAKNFTYQFSEEGYHFIKLIGYNSDMSCFDFKLIRIFAECPAKVELNTTSNLALLGESVHFEANAEVSNTFDWYIDGNFKATGQQFDYIFQNEGTHTVKVISQNNQWNCSDTASTNIMVSCPVKAEFKTDAFFPEINSIVHFTNTSINASTYQWEINDQIISNNKDLNYTFDLPGEYSVCLNADNDDCSKDFCMQIFVLDTGQLNCEDVYYKRIGDPNVNEQGYDFDFIDDNTIAVVGSYDNESLLVLINEKLVVKESYKLDFLSGNEYILNILVDSQKDLIISGIQINSANGRKAFIAKFDLQNKKVIWKRKIEDTKVNYPIFWNIIQLSNGNYIAGGKTYITDNNCDAFIMEINKANGAIIWSKTYDAGSCDAFSHLLEHNNNLYGTGRFAINSSSESKFRGILMKMDKKGKEIWTKNYIFPVSSSSRIYPYDMIFDNGIVILQHGDENGSNTNNSKIQLLKTDINGNLLFSKGFYFENTKYNKIKKLLVFPDGYLIFGDYKYDSSNRNAFLIKTDKAGSLSWYKSYRIGKSCLANSVEYNNNYLYLTGTSIEDSDEDIYILKLDIDGNIPVDCNDIIKSINLKVKSFNSFTENINVSRIYGDIPYKNTNLSQNKIVLKELDICKKDCFDSCSVVPDATFSFIDIQCLPDSFELNFEICNNGNRILPINTPVSFYDNNPVNHVSNFVNNFYIPDSIPKGECNQYSYKIPILNTDIIFGFVNDNGTLSTPFIPVQDLPNTGVTECNWYNNIDQIKINQAKAKKLDLGQDTVICVSGTVTLNAGSGFASYKWNDGSTDSIYTAWHPGQFWVKVVDECENIQSDTINIIIDPATEIDLGEDLTLCSGEQKTISINGFEFVEWDINGEITQCTQNCSVDISPDSNTTVIVKAYNNNGCYSSDTLNIEIIDKIGIVLPQDTFINLGDKILIIPIEDNQNDFIYSWNPPDGLSCIDCFSPEAGPLQSTKYTLIVTDENGCTASDDIFIAVRKDTKIYIPNVFTPNGDGVNDVFYVRGNPKGIKGILKFQIYDRWGELIFEEGNFQINDPLHGWDGTFKGKKANPDVFVYVATLELIDNSIIIKKGDITVLK